MRDDAWFTHHRARIMIFFRQLVFPKLQSLPGPGLAARTVRVQTGGNDADLAEAMIKDHEAVVKTNVTIGQFQIIRRPARQFWLREIFQVVTPKSKRAAERKR